MDGAVGLVRLDPTDIMELPAAIQGFSLDFDDAYQYVAARKHGMTIISFDADFDRTDLGRKTPSEAMT